MPISQQRMLRLIAAAEDFEAGLQRASQIVDREAALAKQGHQTAATALFNISLLVQRDLLLSHPVETAVALASEKQHFSGGKVRDNEREAARAKRRREARQPPAEVGPPSDGVHPLTDSGDKGQFGGGSGQ